jgi:hypothetical protein
MADLIFNIDIKAALAALLRLNKGIDDTGKKADDSFGRAVGRVMSWGALWLLVKRGARN